MPTDDSTTALFAAAEAGDAEAARRALAAGAVIEARDRAGRTPLIVAAKAGRVEAVGALLEAGADPNAQDDMRDSAFLCAGAEGQLAILRLTLDHGADVTSTNRYGGTALIPASERAHVETVRTLIAAGVPLDHINRLGWTALLEAIVLGNGSPEHVDVVRQLVAAGANVSIADSKGVTPLENARGRGFAEIAGIIESADETQETASRLVERARVGDVEAVRTLLADGASVTFRDQTGATALTAAAYGNHIEVARLLAEAGADPNVADQTVQSAYLIATSEVGNDPRLLDLLLDHGANVRALDSWKGTGLIRAADRGHDRIVERLLRTETAIDHVNRIGYTALHEAVLLGDGGPDHQRTVAALVDAGVDTSIEDGQGNTALDSARRLGHREIARVLG